MVVSMWLPVPMPDIDDMFADAGIHCSSSNSYMILFLVKSIIFFTCHLLLMNKKHIHRSVAVFAQ